MLWVCLIGATDRGSYFFAMRFSPSRKRGTSGTRGIRYGTAGAMVVGGRVGGLG